MKVRYYKLINPENNEIYVGSTTQSVNDRFWQMTRSTQRGHSANEYRQKYPNCSIVQIDEWEIPDKYCEERFIIEQYYIDYTEGIKTNKLPAWSPNSIRDANRRFKSRNREEINKKDRERALCPNCGIEKTKRYIKYHLQKGCENGRRCVPKIN